MVDLAERIAGLSPEKRELLRQQLKNVSKSVVSAAGAALMEGGLAVTGPEVHGLERVPAEMPLTIVILHGADRFTHIEGEFPLIPHLAGDQRVRGGDRLHLIGSLQRAVDVVVPDHAP